VREVENGIFMLMFVAAGSTHQICEIEAIKKKKEGLVS